jgi:mannan endo-1,4-beta-mannosidase
MLNFLSLLALFFLANSTHAGMVSIQNGTFQRDGKPYVFLGANFWQGMNLGSAGKGGNRALLLRELDQLKSMGVKNLRILAISEGPSTEPYRIVPANLNQPGSLDETLLQGLDFLLVEMKKRDLTAVVVLGNFWPWSGGFAQWVSWFEGSTIPYPPPAPEGSWSTFQEYSSRFYTLPKAILAHHGVIRKIVGRINSLTREAYVNDPTILSWELANEPRGGKYRKPFLAWIKSTSRLIKGLDPNHLITTGSEGETLGPKDAGNDFIEDHSIPTIDYATLHVWVENWGVYNPKDESSFQKSIQVMREYLEDHWNKSKILKKPMIIEEFGMARDDRSMDPESPVTHRNEYYEAVFSETAKQIRKGYTSGVNFWAWSGESKPNKPYGSLWKPGDSLLGDPPHEEQGWYGVYRSDSTTIELIKKSASLIETSASPLLNLK